MSKQLSAASKRASQYPSGQSEWLCGFTYTSANGLGYEEGIHRRDPSSVIKVNDKYYVYYTKSIGVYFGQSHHGDPDLKIFPWDKADIWYATSLDGINWAEQGCAVVRGDKGAFDDRTVCTPDVMAHEDKYYLVYQTQTSATTYDGGTESVGMAVANSPDGPWEKVDSTIIEPMDAGYWFDDEDSYNTGYFRGVTHDPILFAYNGRFHLYYKCGSWQQHETHRGQRKKYAGVDTRWGVAMADNITGPYTHSELNPITNSGHETLLWQYQGGIVALLNRDGPEKETIQYAPDGVNFEIMSSILNSPQAGGAYRPETSDDYPLQGIQWGMCHIDERGSLWNYILRFDMDPRFTYPLNYVPSNNHNIF